MDIQTLISSTENNFTMEHLYLVEGYHTLKISVKSGVFAGSSNFCISKGSVHILFEELSNMYKELKGYCKLEDYDSDAYIMFEMEKLGHLCISGQIGGSHESHNMKFKFYTDQTVLLNFIKSLKELL
ncbi:hypothetical protein [Pelosinus fermentans]|uniref:Uncharacterized protein n=1 Tax=Pelosinus fermentans B4 TaxID=1149862 RepID=I9LFG7_9FIRM|nr:hypothetical protein [Pelosinus fermentans]EIW19111.1 hypothetical protein FB4_0636 [Pelosinus fermentans B4]EIW21670.1 hypothetical protein FA11_0477 [Pelosinus fermentans A11]